MRKKQQITYKGTPIRLSDDFSTETLQARKECHSTFKVMTGRTYSQEHSTQQGFHSHSVVRPRFTGKQKLKGFCTHKPTL